VSNFPNQPGAKAGREAGPAYLRGEDIMKIQNAGKILIVEDSPPGRDIIATFLENIGFQVLQAPDGETALRMIQQNVGAERDLVAILADLRMPKMDGMELLRNIRENAAIATFKDIPFLLVTATSDQTLIAEAIKLKVNGYILKPVSFERIQQKLRTVIGKMEN
jgi:two-component system chemotaxis response regulator CheY